MKMPREARAFRGYDGEHFPDHEFEGLFGKGVHGTKINDIIEGIRYEKGGLIGGLIGGRATVETHGEQMRNGGLIGGLASRGRGFWQTHPELLEDIVKFRNEGLTWK